MKWFHFERHMKVRGKSNFVIYWRGIVTSGEASVTETQKKQENNNRIENNKEKESRPKNENKWKQAQVKIVPGIF